MNSVKYRYFSLLLLFCLLAQKTLLCIEHTTAHNVIVQKMAQIIADAYISRIRANKSNEITIVDFNKEKHEEFIRTLFTDNIDYLASKPAQAKFSIDYMIDNMRLFPYSNPITIKIATNKNNIPYGFVIYSNDFNNGNIDVLCVDQKYRKFGCGTQLLQHAINELKKAQLNNITIGVHHDNISALTLYKKHGFTFSYHINQFDDIYRLTTTA